MHMSSLPSKHSQNNGNTNIREFFFFRIGHIELLFQLSGVGFCLLVCLVGFL